VTPAAQQLLRPPAFPSPNSHHRFSTISSTSSVLGFSSDSKYAFPYLSFGQNTLPKAGFLDQASTLGLYERFNGPDNQVDDDDYIHDPSAQHMETGSDWSWRGFLNVFGTFLKLADCLSQAGFLGATIC
jgi:hypothetical protein